MKIRIRPAEFSSINAELSSIGKLSRSEAKEIGEVAVTKMKALIARGKSPLGGKFPRYKNPKRYPGKRKPHSPVNLKLSGDFLDDLSSRPVKDNQHDSWSASVGYSDPKQKIKEQGHREGANGQPERPTIPDTERGETFASEILIAVADALRGILKTR